MKNKYSGIECFWGSCRRLIEKVVPETSCLYKWLYLNGAKFHSKRRNRRKERLSFKYHTVDSCNLDCIGCSTFSPLIKDSFVDINSFENDIKRVAELGSVEKMELIGGEVLLHPKVKELIEISRKYIETGRVVLVTNGVLLFKQNDDFWKSCERNKIIIEITPYPIKMDYNKIKEIAGKYGIELNYYYKGKKTFFMKIPLKSERKKGIVKSFNRCMSSNCATLRDGKMYSCYRPYCIKFFNKYFNQNFEITEKDYKDIYKVKDKNELLDFLCKPLPFCRYCDLDNMKFGIPWGISKKEISEWM